MFYFNVLNFRKGWRTRMFRHSLLMRIRNPNLATAKHMVSDDEIRESILLHVRRMCSTRIGTMLTCPDFGICSIVDLTTGFPEATATIARSIRATIQAHEPRLTQIVVKHVPQDTGDLTLRFEISAYFYQNRTKSPLKFETRIDSRMQVDVR